MKLFITFYCSLFLFSGVFGQDKFGPGFYVNNLGDTIRGYVQYKNDYNKRFQFRQQLKSSSEWLSVEKVKSVGLNFWDTYERIENTGKQESHSAPFLVKILVAGEIDLFASNDQYYIASEKKGRFQLAQGKAVDQGEALKNYQTNTGIFNILFQDCPSVREAAQKVTISEENLMRLISSYHTCRGVPHKEFPSKKGKRDNHLGFFAGQSTSNLSFGEPNTFGKGELSYLYYSNFAASTQPTFGVTALLGGRGPSSIISIQSELIYTKANYSASYKVDESIPNYDIKQTYATTVDYSRLSLLAGLRITGRSNTLNPYFSFGLATQRFLSMNLHVHQTIEVNSSVEIRDYELPVSNGSFAVWTAAGVKKKIFGNKFLFLDVNYENSYISYSARITALSLRAGFMF